jgi:hypothetical protein
VKISCTWLFNLNLVLVHYCDCKVSLTAVHFIEQKPVYMSVSNSLSVTVAFAHYRPEFSSTFSLLFLKRSRNLM